MCICVLKSTGLLTCGCAPVYTCMCENKGNWILYMLRGQLMRGCVYNSVVQEYMRACIWECVNVFRTMA